MKASQESQKKTKIRLNRTNAMCNDRFKIQNETTHTHYGK